MSALGQKQTYAMHHVSFSPASGRARCKKQMWLWAKSDIITHSIASPAFNFRDDSSPARFRIECDLLTFATFSMHSGHATSSISGAMLSAAGEIIIPICRSQLLQVMLSGSDIDTSPILAPA